MQDPKSQAKAFLAKGRKELSLGNLLGAAHWYQKSAEQPAQFNPGEDSPDRLLEDIRRAGGKWPTTRDIPGNLKAFPAVLRRGEASPPELTKPLP